MRHGSLSMFAPARHPAELADEEPVDPRALLREATVVAVDLENGLVELKTGEVRTPPIRFDCGRSGDTRIWSPPSVGEQMLLFCPEGDIERAFALAAIPSDQVPPAGNSLAECILYADGARLSYDPETHALAFALPDGATVSIVSKGGVTVDVGEAEVAILGNVRIDGDVAVTGEIRCERDVIGAGISLKEHRHKDVQAGLALTGKPA